MFGLNKLKEAKEEAQKLKSELDATHFIGTSSDQMVKAVVTGSKNVVSIDINDSIFKIRAREEVQSLVVEAINNASTQADSTIREKMKGILPNIPGLDF